MKRLLPAVLSAIVLAGACLWLFAAAQRQSEPPPDPFVADSATATTLATRHWSNYSSEDSTLTLGLPGGWLGAFIGEPLTRAEIAAYQSVSPELTMLLQKATELADPRPIFAAVGLASSKDNPLAPVALFIFPPSRRVSALDLLAYEQDEAAARLDALRALDPTAELQVLTSPGAVVYEFSLCTSDPDTSLPVCIREYHVLRESSICYLRFSSPPDLTSEAVKDLRSIARGTRCNDPGAA